MDFVADYVHQHPDKLIGFASIDPEAKWLGLLGAPDITASVPTARLVETITDQNYTGKLIYLQVEPDWWEKIFIMMPSMPLGRFTSFTASP